MDEHPTRLPARLSLRYHLVLLVLAAALPVLLFAGVIVRDLGREQRASVERGLRTTVRALAIATEREIEASIRSLEMLATSEALRSGDLRSFHGQAVRAVAAQEVWYIVALTDATGQILASSVRPFGERLPWIGDRDYIRHVIATGRPAVSDLISGRTTGQRNVSVAVPVTRDGALRYILFAGINPVALGRILAAEQIPSDWIASISDTNQVFIARNRDPERFVGRELIPPLRAAVRAAPEGAGHYPVFDSPDVLAAWQRVPSFGWTVTLGTPVALVDAALRRSMWRMVGIGTAVALAGGAIALVWARRISGGMHALASSAAALGRGEDPGSPSLPIAEMDVVAQAMRHAGREIRAKDRFLASLAHELRTPLSAVLSAAGLLRAEAPRTARAMQAVERIERNTRLQARLVSDLLEVSRMVAGKLRVERVPLSLPPVVEEAVASLRHEAEAKGVKLEASVQRPPGPVLGDAARIQQIALNLIANAIKFTPAGGRVDVIVSCRGPSAVLTVRDTGHGVEPALLPHVFEPFTQGMTERRHEGLGLGLAIVRHLVELHHGTVLVESAGLGAGTTVTVELPLAVSVPVREGAAEPRA